MLATYMFGFYEKTIMTRKKYQELLDNNPCLELFLYFLFLKAKWMVKIMSSNILGTSTPFILFLEIKKYINIENQAQLKIL